MGWLATLLWLLGATAATAHAYRASDGGPAIAVMLAIPMLLAWPAYLLIAAQESYQRRHGGGW